MNKETKRPRFSLWGLRTHGLLSVHRQTFGTERTRILVRRAVLPQKQFLLLRGAHNEISNFLERMLKPPLQETRFVRVLIGYDRSTRSHRLSLAWRAQAISRVNSCPKLATTRFIKPFFNSPNILFLFWHPKFTITRATVVFSTLLLCLESLRSWIP